MKTTFRSRVLAFFATIVLPASGIVAFSQPAQARSLGSYAGKPLDQTPLSCFQENAAGTIYAGGTGCPTTARWEVNLPYDGTFPATINVRAKSASSTVVASCQAFGVNNMDSLTTSSSLVTAGTSWTTLTLSVPSVPDGGDLFVFCNVGVNAEVGSINW